MAKKIIRTLTVYPNPFLHVDDQGRPIAAVPYPPRSQNDIASSKRFIGMTMHHEIVETAPDGSAQQNMQETWFEPTGEPVSFPIGPRDANVSAYIRQCIRSNELIAANEVTSKAVGEKKFVEPIEALKAWHETAKKHLKKQSHEDHGDEIHDALAEFDFFANKKKAKEALEAEEKAAKEKEAEDKKAQAEADAEAKAKAQRDAENAKKGQAGK
jgi:hypothetical protein